MAKEWIAGLAEDIRNKNHEAAENYNREQHRIGIIDQQGRSFFNAFVRSLEENFNELRSQLQGDVTSSETIISGSALQIPTLRHNKAAIPSTHAKASDPKPIEHNEVILTRSRFPWFDARIKHHNSIIALDYAKGLGVAGDPTVDRKTLHFAFHVAADDTLSVQEAFGDNPRQFDSPEELAQHITQLLFQI